VITHDGYRAVVRPAAVERDGERLEVVEIEFTWVETGVDTKAEVLRGFIVRCRHGARFRLIHGDDSGWRGELLPGPVLVP
jgi:hypothetical protein